MATHVYYHIGRIQRRLQRKSLLQRLWHKMFPNAISFVVTIVFLTIIMWLALGAPMP